MEERKKQASNIDQAGNVLYLDQERLDRKEVGFPPYQNKPNGLGIFNWLVEHVLYMNDKRWPLALKLYHMFVRFSVWMKEGGWKARLYKTGIKLYPDMERQTSTLVMPLNVDVTDQGEKVVVPLDLIKESLKNVTYIAGMDTCLCREANQCKDYPMDVACLFLGEPAKTVVKHGLGRFFTYEEACARVDEAARHGLMGQAVWIEVEQILWGVRNDEMDRFLEICFCCPCCCIAMRLARNATPAERHRFHPSGGRPSPTEPNASAAVPEAKGPTAARWRPSPTITGARWSSTRSSAWAAASVRAAVRWGSSRSSRPCPCERISTNIS